MPWRRLAGLVLLAGLLLAAPADAHAKVELLGVENWGLGGAVKTGLWSVLYVELKSTGEDFKGTLVVDADAGQRMKPLFTKDLDLARNMPTRHWVYFRTPMWSFTEPRFTWTVRDRRGRVVMRYRWAKPVVIKPEDAVVVVFPTQALGPAGLGTLVDEKSRVRVHVKLQYPNMAPDRTVGYEAADALVWLNPDPSRLPTVAQAEAIEQYVRRGGHLVLSAGREWQALAKSFLAPLLPATPTGSRRVADLPALGAYGLPAGADRRAVVMQLAEPRGEVLMRLGRDPVIVRGRIGLGRVTLIGFDPTKKPFSDVQAKKRFWQEMLAIDAPHYESTFVSTRNASGPLVRTLNDFPGFKPINFVLVGLFLVSYVVLIGPVDYFVLKRLKRLHWTWVTFPSIAILSSLMAFVLLSSGRVVRLMTNSVSIVDASVEDDSIAGTTILTMLSPRQTDYDVALEDVTSGWLTPRRYEVALDPTSAFGGDCQVADEARRIRRMLVRVWDAQTMEAGWRAPAPDLPEVTLDLTDGRLTGRVSNTTPDPLVNAAVLHQSRAYHLGTISPGASAGLRGARSVSLADYAKGLCPQEFRRGYYEYDYGPGYDRRQSEARCADADTFARWVSLFGVMSGAGDGRLRRFHQEGEQFSNQLAFDLPARAQLTGLNTGSEAILMYGVNRTFPTIRLEGRTPDAFDWSLVRLRVPVAAPDRPEGDAQ